MNQYCVVVCGLRAGTSDEASAWAPVAAALRMEQDEFARRVLTALPRIVRRQLDQATAGRIAQLLQGMHVDARALPDDARLAYIERGGRSRGPLPQSALGMFIEPGESFRLQGSQAWQPWPEPPEHEAADAPSRAIDEAMVAPVDERPVEAPADRVENEAQAPSTEGTPPTLPPPLPTEPSPPEASAPTLDDEATTDDALINPPQGEEDPAAAEEPVEAGADQPRRSRHGRLLVVLVIVGVAAWAYLHRMADSHMDDTPPPAPVAHASHSADSSTTAPASTTSVGATPVPAASATAADASSAPAPAASAPAAAGTAALPAATATITAPATAASAAPAQASSMVPATATSAPPAHAGSAAATPAAASSAPQG